MHFKILKIHFKNEKSGKKSGKIFETGAGAGTGYWSRISGRIRIQPDIRSVPNMETQKYQPDCFFWCSTEKGHKRLPWCTSPMAPPWPLPRAPMAPLWRPHGAPMASIWFPHRAIGALMTIMQPWCPLAPL